MWSTQSTPPTAVACSKLRILRAYLQSAYIVSLPHDRNTLRVPVFLTVTLSPKSAFNADTTCSTEGALMKSWDDIFSPP
jgi:hypothetical protein